MPRVPESLISKRQELDIPRVPNSGKIQVLDVPRGTNSEKCALLDVSEYLIPHTAKYSMYPEEQTFDASAAALHWQGAGVKVGPFNRRREASLVI